jgi:hypothetical protein
MNYKNLHWVSTRASALSISTPTRDIRDKENIHKYASFTSKVWNIYLAIYATTMLTLQIVRHLLRQPHDLDRLSYEVPAINAAPQRSAHNSLLVNKY